MDQIKTGKFIAAMRKEKGLTQRELADALEISDKTVSKWETGKGLPEVGLMLPLCGILDINANELLSGQRLTADTYQQKAEENLMKILNEKQINQRRLVWTAVMDVVYIAIAFFIAWVAAWVEMPQVARLALAVSALLVCVLGVAFVCVVDRTTGYFQCGHCRELFVPDTKTYLKGSWSILPGSARFTCPYCGKTGKCRRRLER